MIGASMFAQVDFRCRQLFPQGADIPFSNLNVVALIGDFAQLPPVKDSPLYAPPSATAGDLAHDGSVLYLQFRESYCLRTPEAKAQFKGAMCLFARRVEVEAINLSHLVALNQPCARIMAKHDGGSAAAEVEADFAFGLEPYVVLARGAKVMLTRNIWQELGLQISKAFFGFCSHVLNSFSRVGQCYYGRPGRHHLGT